MTAAAWPAARASAAGLHPPHGTVQEPDIGIFRPDAPPLTPLLLRTHLIHAPSRLVNFQRPIREESTTAKALTFGYQSSKRYSQISFTRDS